MTTQKLWMKTATKALCVAVGAWLLGCSGDTLPPSTCAATDQICGVCAGVPSGDVCAHDNCVQDVICMEVVAAASDAELSSAMAAAKTGTCVALAPGQYGAIDLPGGVSLLGRSASTVTVGGITVGAGAGAVLRGLGVGSAGVELLEGATGVRIESVRITGSPDVKRHGIALAAGTSATIVTSTIDGAGRVGVYAKDADVTLDRCIVSGAHATGVWIEGSSCDATCACAGSPTLTVSNSAIRDNHVLGLSTRGSIANLMCTDVTGTLPGDTIKLAQNGGGVTATHCSSLSATKLRVLDSADWGIFIDGSTAKLGIEASPDETVEISRSHRGLWVQNVVHNAACQSGGGCVELHNGTLAGNCGIGIGVAGATRGVVIRNTGVVGTLSTAMPIFDENGMVGTLTIGDGVCWLEGSEVIIEDLTLSDSERQSLLIDGPATGEIRSITLEGGDANKAPLQQNWIMGDAQPELESGVTLTTQDTHTFGVPQTLSAPEPF